MELQNIISELLIFLNATTATITTITSFTTTTNYNDNNNNNNFKIEDFSRIVSAKFIKAFD